MAAGNPALALCHPRLLRAGSLSLGYTLRCVERTNEVVNCFDDDAPLIIVG